MMALNSASSSSEYLVFSTSDISVSYLVFNSDIIKITTSGHKCKPVREIISYILAITLFLHRIIIAAHLRATGYPAEAVVCRPSGGGFRNRYRDRMLVDVHVVNEVARRRIG